MTTVKLKMAKLKGNRDSEKRGKRQRRQEGSMRGPVCVCVCVSMDTLFVLSHFTYSDLTIKVLMIC